MPELLLEILLEFRTFWEENYFALLPAFIPLLFIFALRLIFNYLYRWDNTQYEEDEAERSEEFPEKYASENPIKDSK